MLDLKLRVSKCLKKNFANKIKVSLKKYMFWIYQNLFPEKEFNNWIQ